MIFYWLLFSGWLLYCVLHSLLADEQVKVKVRRTLSISVTAYRVLYNVFALGSLIALLIFHFSKPAVPLYNLPSLSIYLAPLVTLVGLTGMIVCILKYFKQLSGLSGRENDPPPVLETRGIHKYVRHPLYASTFVFLIGLFLFMPNLPNLIAVLVIIVYTIIGIRFEEKKLVKVFGDAYLAYQKDVPMLVPRWKK